MAGTLDHAFFYNSQDGDRKYDAESFEYWLKKFFTSGVFNGDLQVTASDGMTIEVSGGYANADGKVRFFASEGRFTLETAHATYDRIDTVVVERNDADRDVTRKVITGGYSSNPAPTPPVRSGGIYQLVVCQIYVAHGAVSISQNVITDTRMDSSVCGYVTGTVQEMDFSGFLAQFQSFLGDRENTFNAWFQTVQDTLGDDVAGALLLLIQELQQDKLDKSGGTMTGNTTVPAPTQAGHIANKHYVDEEIEGRKSSLSVTLLASGWSNNTQTVAAQGVTAGNDVIVSPVPFSFTAYTEAVVRAMAQGSNSLTFTCENVPSADMTVNLVVLN